MVAWCDQHWDWSQPPELRRNEVSSLRGGVLLLIEIATDRQRIDGEVQREVYDAQNLHTKSA
jgi:hypothetical protein